MKEICKIAEGETIQDYLWRLGCMKKTGALDITWDEIAELLNELVFFKKDESTWRKLFASMYKEATANRSDECANNGACALNTGDTDGDKIETRTPDVELDPKAVRKDPTLEARLLRVQAHDERVSTNRAIRTLARGQAIYDLFKEAITRYDAATVPHKEHSIEFVKDNTSDNDDRAIYAMLSDIHYGLTYHNTVGDYDSQTARKRVLAYADAIIEEAQRRNIDLCFVSLMGDLISGIIHNTIRLENKENVVEQVVGVSELIAEFLAKLSANFFMVFVNHTPGNHSRVDFDRDNSLRKEKLDSLVPWYCKTKLENLKNIVFNDSNFDDTIAQFEIFNKTYVAVHGDYDNNLSTSAQAIGRVIGKRIDYLLAGHLHVPEMRIEEIGFIRNGSVCGSGDDYTMRKRLYAPPSQVFLICSPNGIDSIHPVNLGGV